LHRPAGRLACGHRWLISDLDASGAHTDAYVADRATMRHEWPRAHRQIERSALILRRPASFPFLYLWTSLAAFLRVAGPGDLDAMAPHVRTRAGDRLLRASPSWGGRPGPGRTADWDAGRTAAAPVRLVCLFRECVLWWMRWLIRRLIGWLDRAVVSW